MNAPPSAVATTANPASTAAAAPAPTMPMVANPMGAPVPPVTTGDTGGAAAPAAPADPVAMPAPPMPAADPSACDRACLTAVLDSYFAALAAKDPKMLKVATSLKATENGVVTPFGMGVFQSGGKLRPDTRMDFVDPKEGQIGSQLVFDDGQSMPVIHQVRLKVVAQEVTEIETMAVRQQGAANGFFNVENMKPQPVFKQPIDAEKRATREALKAIVDRYFDALDSGDWMAAMTPLDAMCNRYENGFVTAMGGNQIKSQRFMFDVQRRYLVFDEEMGLVWGMFPFSAGDNTLVVGELFKVIDGNIMMIQAVMAYMPSKAWN